MRWWWLVLGIGAASCALESFERGAARPPDIEPPPDPVSLCALAGIPPRPGIADPDEKQTFVVAVRSVTFPPSVLEDTGEGGFGPKDEVPGFDLDRRCSCTADVPLSCVTAPGAILPNHCDDPDGRDNNLSIALAPLSAVAPASLTDLFSGSADGGAWSVIIEVTGYSGEFDDPRVEVATYGAVGFGGVGGPAWDGQDVWDIRADGFAFDGRFSRPSPISFDPDAYVAEGRLVARLPILDINLSVDIAEGLMRVSDAICVATIEMRANGISLVDGNMGGWLTERDMLRFLSSYRFQPFGQTSKNAALCNNGSPEYNVFRSAACRAADGRIDEGSPDAACNAVSIGVGFTADPARLGAIVDVPFPASICEEEADPRNDACPGP